MIDTNPLLNKEIMDQTFSYECVVCVSRNWAYGYWHLFGWRLFWTIHIYEFCTECYKESDVLQPESRFTKWLFKHGWLTTP